MADKKIRIRSYNVGFGDCFLVTIPDGAKKRHMLVDFGNAPGKGGSNKNFAKFAQNVRDETGGHLDLIVMTHEHLDHMEGFRSQKKIFDAMTVDYVWMSAPSKPGYYKKFPKSAPQKKLRALAQTYADALAARKVQLAPSFEALMLNNLNNVERVEYLRGLPRKKVLYLRRGNSVRRKPFSDAVKITILAPEKDMSVYYGRSHDHTFTSMAKTLTASSSAQNGGGDWFDFPKVRRVDAPLNLSSGDWTRLHESVQAGGAAAIRQIDKAANNTSLVFLIEAHGKRLLFTGDAELESWDVIEKKAARHLKPVDFLKVSHHGSHNGTKLKLLDKLLPVARKSKATVLVSTKSKIYGTTNPVPDASLLKELRKRCKKLVSTDKLRVKLWVDVTL